MQLETVRDYINFNSKNYPDINFVTCPHTETKISNKNLKINLDKLNYYLTVQKKTKNRIINLYSHRKLSEWNSIDARHHVFWNDSSSFKFSSWRRSISLYN